MKIIFKNC